MMNKEERERQEKLLSKLSWLNERAQPDFKGNPPPFEEPKTMQSVEKARRQKARELAGEGDFMPFWHTPVPLAMEATRSSYLAGTDCAKFDAVLERKTRSAGEQRMDPATGLTEIQAALCWNAPRAQSGPRPQCGGAAARGEASEGLARDSGRGRRRLDSQQVSTLPPQERMAAYREEILAHPMYTKDSVEVHGERWRRGTQLTGPIISAPRTRKGGQGVDRRNPIRMVALERAQ